MNTRKVMLSALTAVAISMAVAGHSQAATTQPTATPSVGALQSELLRQAGILGVTVKDVRYILEAGPMASCTVTANLSIPEGTDVTLSATAATCEIASQMVQDAIGDWHRSMVP